MSLIEEALRKQREETEKARGGFPVPTSSNPPPPLPETEEPEEDDAPSHKALPVLIGVVLGGVLLVAAIVWLLLYGFNLRKSEAPALAATSAVAAKVAVTSQVATAAAVTTVAASAPVVMTAPVAVPVPVQPGVVSPATTSSAPVMAVEAPVEAVSSTAVATVVAVVAEPTPSVQKVAVVEWPKLTMTGFIGATRGGKSAAIINGQMVTPGTMVEGVKIEAIDRQGVRISFEGESRTLAVGSSTE